MAVDISSFLNAQAPAPVNPLQMAGQFAQIQHSLASTQNLRNTNAQFQQQFAARQAMGPLLQQSINPQTGEWDINKFAVLASKTPQVAWMLPDILSQAEQRKLTQAQIAMSHIEADMKRNEMRSQVANAALAMNKQGVPMGTALVRAAADPNASRYLFPGGMKEAANFIASLQKMPEQQQQQLVSQIGMQAKKDSDMQKLLFPTPETQQMGGVTQGVVKSPLTGEVNLAPGSGSTLVQQPTVAELNKPETVTGPLGEESQRPAYARPGGMMLPGGVQAMGTGTLQPLAPVTPPPAAMPNNGATPPGAPSVGKGAAAPEVTPQQAPTAQTGPSWPTKISKLQESQIEAHNKNYVEPLVTQATAAQSMLNSIANLDRLRREGKETLTGPGTEVKQKLAELLMSFGMPETKANKLFGTNVTKLQDLQKNLLQGLAEYMKANFPTRYTQTEWAKMATEGYLSRSMTDAAFEDVKRYMRDLAQLKRTEYRAYRDFVETGGDPFKFATEHWAPVADAYMAKRR